MSKTYNALIIDDHQLIVEGYSNVLNFIEAEINAIYFNLDSANNCTDAYQKIKTYQTAQNLDLVILDLSLPAAPSLNLNSGNDLGQIIRQTLPNTKIIVCTFYADSFRLVETLNAFNPIGFINKQDVTFIDLVQAIKDVLAGKTHYSQTILTAIKQKSLSALGLDASDILILKELSNGSKMRDLIDNVYLSKSAIDKRKRIMRAKLNIDTNSDRDLVLAAKAKGII
jgi:DNA-binding NarL/FixJ family response regulator